MNVFELLSKQLKKNLYIVFTERFKSETSDIHIERYAAKHILLKPELIVVNDQIHGFKKLPDQLKNLEKFPIFVEMEYSQSDDGEKFMENIELYTEADLTFTDKLKEVERLAKIYSKNIIVEQLSILNEKDNNALVIYSRINDVIADGYIEQDIQEGLISPSDVEHMLGTYLVSFINFIKLIDDLLHKGKDLKNITRMTPTIIREQDA